MNLELAVAPRNEAEAAFFEADDTVGGADEIPRVALENFSEAELATLATLLCGGYEPRLALDGDVPEDVISEADPRLVAALAALPADARAPLANRWQAALAGAQDEARLLALLEELCALASNASTRRHALLYAQIVEGYAPDPEFD